MKRPKTLLALLLLLIVLAGSTYGQSGEHVEMADLMRSDGKIYVVVAVALIVMLGLIIYVISIDRKLNRIEKKIKG
jgi:hypothetical protein